MQEVQEAHDELQRLTNTCAAEGDADGKGAGDQSTQGRQAQAEQLLEQLATLLPPTAEQKQQLVGLRDAAARHQAQQKALQEQQLREQQHQQQQAAAAKAAAAAPAAAAGAS